MATLSGNKVKDTYTSLLKLESNGVTSTLKTVEDGAGVDSAIELSTDTLKVTGTLEVDGDVTFTSAPSTSSTEVTGLFIDSNNNVVKRDLDTSAFSSGTTITFANPMLILRPTADYTLTTTASLPSTAAISNSSNERSHEINDDNAHLQIGSDPAGCAHVQRRGLVKIEVGFFLTLSNNTDVDIDVIESYGGTTTTIASITRTGTGDMAIGFSIIRYANDDTRYYYKIARDTNGAGTLNRSSTFSVTKLD